MNIGVTGIISDQKGQLLVIKRDDTRTWAPPGGGLEVGESPEDGVVREVEEETGFKVMPLRLVGVHFATIDDGWLQLVFRCLMRGGEAKVSEESLDVGLIPTNPIKAPMFEKTKRSAGLALRHAGGPPDWESYSLTRREKLTLGVLRKVVYPYKDVKRKLLKQPAHVPAKAWSVAAFTVIQNEDGAVLWVQRGDNGRWNLPGGGSETQESPWQTAIRETKEETGLDVRLTDLTGIYTKPNQQEMIFVFSAEITGGTLTKGAESADFAYVKPGAEPDNTLHFHMVRVADAVNPLRDKTVFKTQMLPKRDT